MNKLKEYEYAKKNPNIRWSQIETASKAKVKDDTKILIDKINDAE